MLTLLLASALAAPLAASDPLPLQEAALAAEAGWPLQRVWIHIDKSDHVLTLHAGDVAVKRYQTGLGDPAGDKVQQGDRKTPEGTFRVVTRNPQSRFHLFLGLSYPMTEDAKRGQEDGLISEAQARRIREADAARRQPPWNTTLGGAIGIHGNGGSSDWTLGCIAVDDDEIEELWGVVKMGTKVVIEP
jgi:murein L,D-transpeptidase YafK